MQRRIAVLVVVGAWMMGLVGGPAVAHAAEYLVNQDYETLKKGEFEVEMYNDFNFAEADHSGSYNSKHQVELEYGVLDRLQLAYYDVYTWDRPKDWERDAFKIEVKYRFAEAGQWPVDVALYTEYENPDGPRAAHSDVVEQKLILSKAFGRWHLIANAIVEKQVNTGSHWDYEYTAGVSYDLTPKTHVEIEVKEGLGDSKDFDFSGRQLLYLIPSLSMTITPHVRLLVGPAFGMTRASDDLQLKSIMEVEF